MHTSIISLKYPVVSFFINLLLLLYFHVVNRVLLQLIMCKSELHDVLFHITLDRSLSFMSMQFNGRLIDLVPFFHGQQLRVHSLGVVYNNKRYVCRVKTEILGFIFVFVNYGLWHGRVGEKPCCYHHYTWVIKTD